jgi:hypothetical protein
MDFLPKSAAFECIYLTMSPTKDFYVIASDLSKSFDSYSNASSIISSTLLKLCLPDNSSIKFNHSFKFKESNA